MEPEVEPRGFPGGIRQPFSSGLWDEEGPITPTASVYWTRFSREMPGRRNRRRSSDSALDSVKWHGRGDETIMLREWMIGHKRMMYVIFLALAALNGWASYKMFQDYPLFAIPNAAMAVLLALFVISTW